MEIVLGFFGTDKMNELRANGIKKYGDFSAQMMDLMKDNYPKYATLDIPIIPALDIVLMAMHKATKIHFICTGLDLAYRVIGPYDDHYTMSEYYAIMSTTSFRDKTRFYGRRKNPKAQLVLPQATIIQIADFKNKYQIT